MELLQYLADRGNIDLPQIQAEYEAMRRKDIVEKFHKNKIWQGKDGKFRTYVNVGDNRKMVCKAELDELYKVVEEYIRLSGGITFRDMMDEFINRKISRGDIKQASKTRYYQVFDRHFTATGLDQKDMRFVSPEELSDWIEDETARCDLSAKGLSSLKGILKGIIQRARKNKLIDYHFEDVISDVDVKTRKVRKTSEEQILTERELPELINFLIENQDTRNLCLLFMIVSGIRCGEMVGLKYEDFLTNTSAKIRRAETKYLDEDGVWHKDLDTPKTDAANRTVFIPNDYGWIVEKLRILNPDAVFLAVDEHGERMHTEHLRRRLYKICRDLGFHNKKSPHKLRKTFCSILLDKGFDKNLIISLMGHTDIKTSETFYHFDRKSGVKKQKMMDEIVEFK